jgi:hypothetical protein
MLSSRQWLDSRAAIRATPNADLLADMGGNCLALTSGRKKSEMGQSALTSRHGVIT